MVVIPPGTGSLSVSELGAIDGYDRLDILERLVFDECGQWEVVLVGGRRMKGPRIDVLWYGAWLKLCSQ